MLTIEFEDYIDGMKFRDLGELWLRGVEDWQTFHIRNRLIVYINTHDFNDNIHLASQYSNEIVLITHNSDGKITKNPNKNDADLALLPPTVVKWFGCNIIDHNDRTISIPTGLENTHHFPELNKARKIFEINSRVKNIRNLCYMNFNINTNPTERGWLYQNFNGASWVTTKYGGNGSEFENYLNNIYNHMFVLCPEGNSNGHPMPGGGTASHRVWECLYANTIPIITRGSQAQPFEELPILFVDNWTDVTEEFLRSKYEEFQNRTFNVEKLKMSYWKNEVYK